PERLQMAREGGADTVDYSKDNVFEALAEMTGGRGPDSCIDAVGMEAHGYSLYSKVESMKQAVRMQFDRTHALRLCIECVRKGGTVSVPGVYAGLVDKFPVGVAFGKGLTIK